MPGTSPPAAANFEVYKAKVVARTYLVVSTSAVRRGPDPPRLGDRYGAATAFETLVAEIVAEAKARAGGPVPLTMKVHGFNTRREAFEREVLEEAGGEAGETLRPGNRFYIGFRWPSEGLLSRGSLRDSLVALVRSPGVGFALLVLPLLALLWAGCPRGWFEWPPASTALATLRGSLLGFAAAHPALAGALRALVTPYLDACVAATLLGAGLLLLTLRLSTYLRDRYRALHYGVPDLGEFLRAFEEGLFAAGVKVRLDVVGHSMGALLLVNAFRVMSDYFHGHGPHGPPERSLGRDGTFELGTLILCAPDIPVVMATPDHNNYFLSALRRFESLHVFSSDRDIILKWLSSLANWASEPRYDMAGRKLGNVLLVKGEPKPRTGPDSRSDWTLWPMTRPVARHQRVYAADPLGARHPADLHFHDCTLDPSLGGNHLASLAVTSILVLVLGWLALATDRDLLGWLFAVVVLFLGLGAMCRLVWPALRDRRFVRGPVGFFADFSTLTLFLTGWVGWNPHSGYFQAGRDPRRRISGLLRDPGRYPPREQGLALEEQDGRIRYRRVRISV
jgi:hypothetical protein